ncbi:ephrin type-B receptor 1-like [Anastrepha obliqua]|uniref:ephrin type-B receptor 1-like n=1 Tax=Anastrepha obliqua TaxID=95512 RepID=UPI0024096652|nr:ephrin type-B receptor 1-like [Anastrepha obliqua]XP_054745646.1 ephrin type-B receptor 1-like [Anastrepha obliqua]XP_054745647.1 ephrin type-B receptor 1-like [Anastrepha obliqua]
MDCVEMLGLHFSPTCITFNCNDTRNVTNKVIKTTNSTSLVVNTYSTGNIGKTFARKKFQKTVHCHNCGLRRRLQSTIFSVNKKLSRESTNFNKLSLAEFSCHSSRSEICSSNEPMSTIKLSLPLKANRTSSSYSVLSKPVLISRLKLESSRYKMLIIKFIEIVKRVWLMKFLPRIAMVENICFTNLSEASYNLMLMKIRKVLFALSFFIFVCHFGVVLADQVILLDTTREATLEWTRYPYGPQAQTPGWVEESFTDFVKGINWRSYVVCDVAYNNVNNWLWSPFIDRGPANRLYIEIQFTIRDCSLFPGNALSCKETFSLLFYEFDAATREPPPWQTDSYKLIARIAAGEGRFNQNSDVDINTEVKSIAVAKKGVYFAFRDQGACISVLAVKVYYITCPAVTENFAHFNETPTGREITIIEKQNGTCVENAEPFETPTYLCKGDGKWTILTGGCHCKVGYEPDFINKTCNECPIGKFRSKEVDTCVPCPPNSNAPKAAAGFCKCLHGFYRNPRDGKHMPCFKPPGPPSNLTLLFVDQTSAILSWNGPTKEVSESFHVKSNNYRSDIVYKVRCISCSANVVYNPATDTFNETKLTLTNLEPVTTYTIQIHSLNGISYIFDSDSRNDSSDYNNSITTSSGEPESPLLTNNLKSPVVLVNTQPFDLSQIKTEYAEIIFTTESAILSTVFNVRVVATTNKEVDLVWDKPVQSDSPIEFYEVRWFPKSELDAINKTALNTKETKAHIESLNENTEYGFQVRCKTLNGYGTYSNIVYAQTHQGVNSGYDDSIHMRIVAGATVAVVFILVLVIVATVLFLRSKNQEDVDKKSINHLPLPLDYATNEVAARAWLTEKLKCSPQHLELLVQLQHHLVDCLVEK